MNSSLVSHADADHWVHVESCQLARLDDGDAHLEVLRLQARRHRVHRRLRPETKWGRKQFIVSLDRRRLWTVHSNFFFAEHISPSFVYIVCMPSPLRAPPGAFKAP